MDARQLTARRCAAPLGTRRCYAKAQLAKLAGLDSEGTDLPAELETERADIAWLIADTFGPFSHFGFDQETLPFDFAELTRVSGLKKPDEVFEAMARLDHPDVEAVLTMIGKHASDRRPPRPPGGPRTRHPPAEPPAVSAATALWLMAPMALIILGLVVCSCCGTSTKEPS